MARYITRGEGLRILAESMHELKFCMTQEEVEYCFGLACKYKSLTDSFYCGSRSCASCGINKLKNKQLSKIGLIEKILKEVNHA